MAHDLIEERAAADAPFVSVITPVRDGAPLLPRLLDALEAQTYPRERFEVIVVDNGSSDGSGDVARKFAARSSIRSHVLTIDGGGPVSTARNRGAAAASGAVLAFTDSDCRPVAGWIEAGIRALGRADLAQGETRADPELRRGPLHRTTEGGAATGLYDGCNLFVRADAFHEVGGFDPGFSRRIRLPRTRTQREYGFGEDTDLAWRVVRRGGRPSPAPAAMVYHHVFPQSLRETLSRTWLVGGFPGLVHEVPELRGMLLRQRVFLTDDRPWFYLAVAGVVAGRNRRPLLAVAAPYLVLRYRRAPGSRRERLAAMPILIAQDALATIALLIGSVRSGTPVL